MNFAFSFLKILFKQTILLAVLLSITPSISATQSNGKMDILKISSRLYLIQSYKRKIHPYNSTNPEIFEANALIYIDGGNAYLIDTPWGPSDMPDLIIWIKNKGLTLKDTVVTHFHQDRVTGLEYLNKNNFKTFASRLTNRLLKEQHAVQANHSFSGNNFELLKDKIEIYNPGPGHTIDNIVVWLPTERVLMGGCLLRAKDTHTLGYLGDADTKDWYRSIRNIQQHYPNTKLVIPGHGSIKGNRTIITHTLNLANEYNNKYQE